MTLLKIPLGVSLNFVLPEGVTDAGAAAIGAGAAAVGNGAAAVGAAGVAMLNTDAVKRLARAAEVAVWGTLLIGGGWLAYKAFAGLSGAPVKHDHTHHGPPATPPAV